MPLFIALFMAASTWALVFACMIEVSDPNDALSREPWEYLMGGPIFWIIGIGVLLGHIYASYRNARDERRVAETTAESHVKAKECSVAVAFKKKTETELREAGLIPPVKTIVKRVYRKGYKRPHYSKETKVINLNKKVNARN